MIVLNINERGIGIMNREGMLEAVLLELGLPHHIKGYAFTKQSVLMIAKDKSYRDNLCKGLYVDVAKECNTEPNRVERALRHAIEKVFSNTDIEVLKKYFGNSIDTRKNRVSNKHFLITLADYILGCEL